MTVSSTTAQRVRVDAQRRGGGQVDIGKRLAARHFVAAEDAAFEAVEDAGLGELQFDLDAVGARGDRNASVQRGMQRAHRRRRAGMATQFAIERRIAALRETA